MVVFAIMGRPFQSPQLERPAALDPAMTPASDQRHKREKQRNSRHHEAQPIAHVIRHDRRRSRGFRAAKSPPKGGLTRTGYGRG